MTKLSREDHDILLEIVNILAHITDKYGLESFSLIAEPKEGNNHKAIRLTVGEISND